MQETHLTTEYERERERESYRGSEEGGRESLCLCLNGKKVPLCNRNNCHYHFDQKKDFWSVSPVFYHQDSPMSCLFFFFLP